MSRRLFPLLNPLSLSLFLSLSMRDMAPAFFHEAEKTVCVMDAGGRVGAALVKKLLRRGYTVHAATQGDRWGVAKLAGGGESERLKVFRADPFDYQSLLDAVRGCSGLFYSFEPPRNNPATTAEIREVASWFPLLLQEYMAEVEVMAAQNVLEACAQTEMVERVVYTSSVTAVVWRESRRLVPGLDERDWSDPHFCRKFRLWHALAKTLAEKAAWALAMDRGAAEMYEDGLLVTVEDDFLADAHICAFEDPTAYGRYLCFNRVVCRPEDAAELAKMMAVPCPPPSSR
ncbi:unnamed protein product [Spirodela intermedia]|uniref:NAD(P)-binding domain-containing protein n=1 Tax=Spirodela intermedia TaxID=51605 RepID=A0A7I8JJA9_SPIIN|nr:unnamed protein product [Spirodela intermedia]CAA6669653.1 unnamed protein product [Spirodela intermedia]